MNKVSNKKNISIAVAVLLVFCTFSGIALAAGTPSFSISTGVSSVKTGETFDVGISGRDITDLDAYEVHLSYPSGLLDIQEGDIVSGLSSGITHTDIDIKDGKITIAFAKKGNAATENGNVALCTLTFTGKAQGNAQISLESVKLLNGILAESNYTVNEKISVAVSTQGETSPTPTATPIPTTAPTAATTPTTAKDGKTTTATIKVTATADPLTGTASARVEAAAVAALAEKAKEAEAAGQKAVVEIKAEGAADAKAVEVEIPRAAFKQVADATRADIKIDAGIGTITFDAKAVDSIGSAAPAGDISIGIKKVDKASLTEEVQEKVGDRPVFDFDLKAGSTEISDFGGGKAEISIPYTLKPDEKKNFVVVYYIDSTGKLITVKGKYDETTGTVKFTVKHFSRYAIGYNEVNFSDVAEGDWYSEAVGFMAAREIVRGVGGGRFAPSNSVTRADFLIMVMNSYGVGLDAEVTDNFSDAGDKYYTGYLGTAKRLGLVTGVGGGKYAPEATISRQDMFVILYRVLEKLEELPSGSSGRTLEGFSDASGIANYAADAMKLFVETGVVSGDGSNLAPKAASSRAQAAQLLYNLLSK